MIKDYINDIKSHGCIICGENDVSCLDFHHLGDKIIEVSKLIGNDNFK